jgi:hypothetical protein
MPPASRPILPRTPADPEHLRRLREKALANLYYEEQATLVTRRWSLQRLALLIAGLSPALGAVLRGHRAFAQSSTPRCNAPQYGAPGLPGNPPRCDPDPPPQNQKQPVLRPAPPAPVYGGPPPKPAPAPAPAPAPTPAPTPTPQPTTPPPA